MQLTDRTQALLDDIQWLRAMASKYPAISEEVENLVPQIEALIPPGVSTKERQLAEIVAQGALVSVAQTLTEMGERQDVRIGRLMQNIMVPVM